MEQLLNVMRELREKCPWDQQQTPESLTRYAIEEAYEVEAAVRSGKADEVRDELGDLLLQVVFQSQMYAEQGTFNFILAQRFPTFLRSSSTNHLFDISLKYCFLHLYQVLID